MNDKAQSAIEFFILVGFVFFFFVSFLGAIQINTYDKMRESKTLAVKEIALTVQDEVNLALEASDGYVREFTIPSKVLGNYGYTLSIIENDLLYILTDDNKDAMAYPVPRVEGANKIYLIEGKNVIKKVDGKICLNDNSC